MRKLITISAPPALLRRAEQVAREEHRTKSELLRWCPATASRRGRAASSIRAGPRGLPGRGPQGNLTPWYI
jgi:hypothetical protein